MTPPEPRGGEGLLPCPFCGTAPQIGTGRIGGAVIRCQNDQCIVYTDEPIPFNEVTHRSDAIAAWNRRPSSPPSGGGGWPSREWLIAVIKEHSFPSDAADMILGSLRPVVGWRPIETAPKDGTLIMVGAPGCGVSLVRWMLDTWIDEQGFTQGSWPTHFQPLPAAPLTTDGVGE